MKKELDEALCRDFPKIFRDRCEDMRKTCMCWGFECGDGWEPLIRELCENLAAIEQASGCVIVATQVKEKFGGLRFYVHTEGQQPWHRIVDDCIDAAERKSEYTCEACGERGRIDSKEPWLRCLCEKCKENDA